MKQTQTLALTELMGQTDNKQDKEVNSVGG